MENKRNYAPIFDYSKEEYDAMMEHLNQIAKESTKDYLRMQQEAMRIASQIVLNC